MKKILFILSSVIVSLSAKPCMTDIYFGNGVWNPDRDAVRKVQLRGLKILMEKNQPDIFNQNNEGKNYQWRVAFNPSYGTIDDLIETFWQLKESGQITEGYFGAVYTLLTWEDSNEFYNKLDEIITKYNEDVTAMFTLYSNASFNQKHNVLLVAHSQGNLFGNKMYTLMNDKQKKKFRMVSVGTPADHVMKPGQTSPYVTLYGDFVIRPISGSLPANTNGGGHSFIGAYLAKIDARIKIASYVKTAYDNLREKATCNIYDATYMYVYDAQKIEIHGMVISSTPRLDDIIATIPISHFYNPINNQPIHLKCGDDTQYFVSGGNAFSTCYQNTPTVKVCAWRPGYLYEEILESKRGTLQRILSFDQSTCYTLEIDDEIYNIVKSALGNS